VFPFGLFFVRLEAIPFIKSYDIALNIIKKNSETILPKNQI